MSDKLHIPYKFSGLSDQFAPQLRKALSKVRPNDPVTGADLESIFKDIFKYFSGNDRQNWLEVERWAERNPVVAVGGSSPYDATIDPAFASDPSVHRYKNLTELVANETWASTDTFTVGVVRRNNTNITETAAVTTPGPIALICPGQAGPLYASFSVANDAYASWNLASHQIIPTGGIYLEGIRLWSASGAGFVPIGSSQTVRAHRCYFQGFQADNTTIGYGTLTNGQIYATESAFSGRPNFQGVTTLFDCVVTLYGSTNFDLIQAGSQFLWIGGNLETLVSSPITVNCGSGAGASTTIIVGTEGNGSFFGSQGGTAVQLNLAAGGMNYVDLQESGNTSHLWTRVDTAAGPTVLRGAHDGVTIAGSTGNIYRHLDITTQLTAHQFDLTGPFIHGNITMGQGTGTITLRGNDMNLRINSRSTSAVNTILNLVGCTNSHVTFVGRGNAGTSKAYAIDAASANCVLIVDEAGYGVASTNAGTNCLVITPTGTIPTGAAGGDLTGTYPNPTVAGVQAASLDIKIGTAGKGYYVKEGTNATMGVATMTAGTVTVNTTKVTASSRIFLTVQSLGTVTAPKAIAVTARTAGTSFTITSADNTDTSVVAWLIVEPA